MITFSQNVRDRMLRQHQREQAVNTVLVTALPVMRDALTHIYSSMGVQDVTAKEFHKQLELLKISLDILADIARAQSEASALEKEATNSASAALGHLMEVSEEAAEMQHEGAHLAQYHDYYVLAAQMDVRFNLDVLQLVDLPVYAEAIEKIRQNNPKKASQLKDLWQ